MRAIILGRMRGGIRYNRTMKFSFCSQILKRDGVIAYPTEAVWGLGCDPRSSTAVQRILDLKHRPWHKGMIIVAGDISQVEFLLQGISTEQRAILENSWPGPNTWLIPHHNRLPKWVTGQHPTVAVRVSNHPVVQQICREFNYPIVSTSANLAGKNPARSRIRVQQIFSGNIDYIVGGELGGNKNPSTIRDLQTQKILRG